MPSFRLVLHLHFDARRHRRGDCIETTLEAGRPWGGREGGGGGLRDLQETAPTRVRSARRYKQVLRSQASRLLARVRAWGGGIQHWQKHGLVWASYLTQVLYDRRKAGVGASLRIGNYLAAYIRNIQVG